MLAATLREAARRFGDRTAYVPETGPSVTYGDLDRLSDDVARGLREAGLGEGDVLGVVLPPSVEYAVVYLAAAKLGVITAGVNDRLRPAEQRAVLDIATPTVVVTAPDVEAVPPGSLVVRPATALDGPDGLLADLRRPGPAIAPLPGDPDRPVAIIFTSGTTGVPKGAVYCERQLACITDVDVGDAWGTGGRGYSGTSFAHLGFMTKLPGNLRRGGTTFILARWRADACLDLVERERLSTIAGVPTQLALMLRSPTFDSRDLSSVQFLVAGGGPITPGLAEEARARFGARLATRYSCTEAGIGLGTGFDDPEEDAIVSVGRPHPVVDLAVLGAGDEPVAEGEVGEVCLRSPAVMHGYWRDPAATARAFTADGFVRTGDLGWVDDRGRLRLVGRSKEMYVRGGYNVYPVEVEAVLSAHPSVAAVAVVPRPDDVMGEIGVAFVVPRPGTPPPTLDALRTFAADRLAKHKLPEDLCILADLPLTAGEKVDRAALAAGLRSAPRAAERRGGRVSGPGR
jgi:acyl-CoA synthetase (AMP-forming)/AMP-acid ligase II